MADRPLSHRFSVRAVVREAGADYVSHFGLLVVAAFAVFIPAGLIEAAAHGLAEELDHGDGSGAAIIGAVGIALAFTLTATIGDIFYTGVVAAIVAEARGGVRHGLADIARHLPYRRLFVIDLLCALLVGIGVLVLIVPGVIAFVWFSLAAPVVKIEGGGVRSALRRSRELVRGHFWLVLGLLGPVLLLGDALAELILLALHSILGEGFVGHWLASVASEALTAPFFALAAVVSAHHLIALNRGDSAEQSR